LEIDTQGVPPSAGNELVLDTDGLRDFLGILEFGFVGGETHTGTVNKNNGSHKMESSEKKVG
jgi:hypothetical protein